MIRFRNGMGKHRVPKLPLPGPEGRERVAGGDERVEGAEERDGEAAFEDGAAGVEADDASELGAGWVSDSE